MFEKPQEADTRPTIPGKIYNLRKYFILGLLLGLFIITVIWMVSEFKINSDDLSIVTPLGLSFMQKVQNPLYEKILSVKTVDNYPGSKYFPFNLTPIYEDDLHLSSDIFAVMDRDSRELLYSKNLTKAVPIASISKIMTAITALDSAPLDMTIYISVFAANTGEAHMGLSAGERLSLQDLLYGSLLPSGNDAAEAIAEGVGKYQKKIPLSETDGGGARKLFIDEMNRKGQSLGMMDTYFFSPTGLDEKDLSKTTFSTPLDLLALTNYALTNSTFAETVNTKNKIIPYKNGEHKAYFLYNILSLDRSFAGIKGVKPGISDFAKETLVSYIERDGRRIIVVILNSRRTKDDVLAIYKRIFSKS
ncbi:hypothetical protein A3D03_04270 [Candidatus Gottesmanbacteria bacterium RIFCSPHIGHO2_02_FULL_40_13]|uniref:Peptidase S11 D-alanyl-D-alanine carboxypeptidase A N-terminal domain-containing protein n=1 Tax=Candidatus Gottesmanbacteria bacterium RIFCSPHIGHO2_02_FULL_40_13 TaxID=1798384 RepID=A0A1F6A8T1_9BACT|nr:MAG: hypothetical protein A3D03_04270 [Candidatus Gottesmanbacteria bacterium RIFCSPHIGHO2_02_FULL_40_13]